MAIKAPTQITQNPDHTERCAECAGAGEVVAPTPTTHNRKMFAGICQRRTAKAALDWTEDAESCPTGGRAYRQNRVPPTSCANSARLVSIVLVCPSTAAGRPRSSDRAIFVLRSSVGALTPGRDNVELCVRDGLVCVDAQIGGAGHSG